MVSHFPSPVARPKRPPFPGSSLWYVPLAWPDFVLVDFLGSKLKVLKICFIWHSTRTYDVKRVRREALLEPPGTRMSPHTVPTMVSTIPSGCCNPLRFHTRMSIWYISGTKLCFLAVLAVRVWGLCRGWIFLGFLNCSSLVLWPLILRKDQIFLSI